ncbi:MAG: hypothetical protein KW788_03205 [Candidatus Doudnabacteria bacterium]|nr:hypothetical protein [Candidatus Doudnabacteria bacterium]
MKLLAIILISIVVSFSLVNFSQAALVKCGQHAQDPTTEKANECTLTGLFSGVVKVINYLIGSATLLTIGYTLYGGVRMILARGNPQGVETAKKIMFYAIEGLLIVLLAYLIVTYAITVLTGGSFSFQSVVDTLNIR